MVNELSTVNSCGGDIEVEDIEDLSLAGVENSTNRQRSNAFVLRRSAKRTAQDNERPQADSFIPGTQTIYVKTWGCSHNNSDSEYMSGQLSAAGYTITDNKLNADLWLLNSCTVKNPAEDHFRNEITSARKLGKYIVLAGCVPQGQPKSDYVQGLSVVGVQQIDRVVEVVEETLKGNTVCLRGTKKLNGRKAGGASLFLPKMRRNPLIEIIPINTGCLNQCTYCKTKHARGELGSYPPSEIVERARQSFEEGVVEIWLTSEDLGAYGHDIGVTLPQLLWQLVEVIPEGAMMRLGMTNPPYILEHLEEMAKLLNHPRVYSFLHVPVQSGSDSVLMDMKREYCQADFRQVVDFLRERVPDVTIATDVICGFPTETDKDFEETLQLVRDYKFPSLFINQFFARPGTPAAKMTKIPTQETLSKAPKIPMALFLIFCIHKIDNESVFRYPGDSNPTRDVKKRTKQVSDLFNSYLPYGHKVGEQQKVLVTETSHDGQYYVAHNKSYDQVLVPKEDSLLGRQIDVVITSAGKHFMMCDLIKESAIPTSASSIAPKIWSLVSRSESSIWINAAISTVIFLIFTRVAMLFM